jgi:hypothetical protein
MTKTKHTPGPLSVHYGEDYIIINGGEYDDSEHRIAEILGGDDPNEDAALLVAAFNSYDKQCGPRALECAASDLLGRALVALMECADRLEGVDKLLLDKIGRQGDEGPLGEVTRARALLNEANGI